MGYSSPKARRRGLFAVRLAATFVLSLMAAAGLFSAAALAQELAPRAYWPTPKGTQVFSFAYQYSSGDIVTDASLPLVGVDSRIGFVQTSYQQTFSLAGRTATVQFNLPYSWGTTKGQYLGQPASRSISGVGDAGARLSINLLGAPTMNPKEFQQLREDPVPQLGVSLLVKMPTGEYDENRLINVGTNRWAVKPAVGFIYPMRRKWHAEFDFGVWIFGDNDEFLGVTREQNPVVSGEFHLIKIVPSGIWLSLDLNYYYGGRSTINGELRADLQRNSRAGVTLLYPIARGHAIRGSFSTGTVTSSGGDFVQASLVYILAW